METVHGAWAKRFVKLFLFLYKKYAWVTGKDSWNFTRVTLLLSITSFASYMIFKPLLGGFLLVLWILPAAFESKMDEPFFDEIKKKAEPDKIYSMPDIFYYRFRYRGIGFSLAVKAVILISDIVFFFLLLLAQDYFLAAARFTVFLAIFFLTLNQAGSLVYLQSPYKSLYSKAKAKAKSIKDSIKIPSFLPPPLPTPARIRI